MAGSWPGHGRVMAGSWQQAKRHSMVQQGPTKAHHALKGDHRDLAAPLTRAIISRHSGTTVPWQGSSLGKAAPLARQLPWQGSSLITAIWGRQWGQSSSDHLKPSAIGRGRRKSPKTQDAKLPCSDWGAAYRFRLGWVQHENWQFPGTALRTKEEGTASTGPTRLPPEQRSRLGPEGPHL